MEASNTPGVQDDNVDIEQQRDKIEQTSLTFFECRHRCGLSVDTLFTVDTFYTSAVE